MYVRMHCLPVINVMSIIYSAILKDFQLALSVQS